MSTNLTDMAVLAVSVFSAAILHKKLLLSTRNLVGLIHYHPIGSTTMPTTVSSLQGQTRGKSKTKKDGVETVALVPMTRSQLGITPYYNVYDNLNYALLLVTSVAMAFWAAQRVITSVATPVAIALTVAIIALAALSRVDIMSQNVSKQDKIYAAVFGCLGAICIAIILTWLEPQKTFYWGDEPIIGGHAENFMRSFIGFENEIFGVKVASVAHVALKAVMCLLAAALTALMFSPTLRFARAYSLPSSAPEGLAQFISSSPFKSVMLRLHLIMPCVAALLWVRPLSFGLDEHLLAGLQAGTACLAGVIILVNQSTILQRYLDTTVVMWYTLKEASKGGKLDASTLMLTAAKAEAVQRLLCKVAVQVTSLGLIFLACGLGLLALTTRPRDAAVAESLLGFVVWYSGTLWLVYNVVFMWLIRTGSLRS